MAELSQQPRLDMYAQDLLRQSYQAMPISQDVLSQYGQGMAQQVQPPAIENYASQQAPQQFVEQARQQQMMQPDPRRIAYNKLIQDRFNQIANKFGGVQHLAENGALETAQRKAAKDVEMYYGPPPAIEQPEQPLRTQVIPGTNKVAVTINGQTQFLDAAQQQQAQDTVTPVIDATTGMPILGIGRAPDGSIIKFEAPQMATKAAEQNAMLASDVLSSVDSLLADKNALEWAGGKTGTYGGYFFRSIEGTKQKIEQLRDQIGLFGRKSIAGQGQGSISDAEQKMAKDALAQIVTEGTDEQLISSLEAVRNKFGNILGRLQSEASGQPTGQPMSQPAVKPKVRTWVPGKGFQD